MQRGGLERGFDGKFINDLLCCSSFPSLARAWGDDLKAFLNFQAAFPPPPLPIQLPAGEILQNYGFFQTRLPEAVALGWSCRCFPCLFNLLLLFLGSGGILEPPTLVESTTP